MKKLLLLSLVLLTACSDSGNRTSVPGSGGSHIRYFHDPRTNLCFAASGGGNNQTLTIAPCTDEVKKAIEEDNKE